MKTKELYEVVTRNMVAELECGVIPWTKPWKNGKTSGLFPMNAATRRNYRGINIFILWDAAERLGYQTHEWMTFKQAIALDAHVRKGEKGHRVVFTKKLNIKGENDEDERQISMLRSYVVFNVAQIDGLSANEPTTELTPVERQDNAEAFIAATNATIRIGGNTACYIPSLDQVCMPAPEQFSGIEHYYATALHELSHWTAAKPRLDRDLSGRFGTKAYAAEELVAELSAAFLCAYLGIHGELRHAGYIESWITLLKDDDRAIFTAASKASQAAEYLRNFSEPEEQEDDRPTSRSPPIATLADENCEQT